MLREVLAVLDPARGGLFLDGTFGAGGYSCALLDQPGVSVIGLDRDPEAIARAQVWAPLYAGRLSLVESRFSALDQASETPLDGVVLDIGVSSMQIDDAGRGFSFMRDGPLDMRMSPDLESAADLIARLDEQTLADILYLYGEERASRRIARAVVAARDEQPISSTLQLVEIIEAALPKPRPGVKAPHPATRSFQALRIAVNDELGELVAALQAAERALAPGGVLAVVTFHSLEDRIVKRFLQDRCGKLPQTTRYQPQINASEPTFELIEKGILRPDESETAVNPRARSAKLRAARRLVAPSRAVDPAALGLPRIAPATPMRRAKGRKRR
ncbi:MAG: 16S rRNA (cytosine(1402)-N(4))-methyltransferase RsmH [Neomegalonema sp.]|nr:16S rRNA (cytosine(1402)-N(4))-methyltransferase RsmH [Neomegalonema sp.]